ncbi:Serine/threonine-protein kinase PknL [Streptomyces sp. ADI91-18]|nr:Serine/threonine-protein kinase PknL [Streptomyces sp. ADI91-18]
MSAPGDVIDGRFELLDRLGSGGMGTVWRAVDLALHREVAVKEVRPAAGRDDPEFRRVLRERVLREARAQARISHPNVVTIHHIVDEGEHPWLVMELLPGHSLDQRLEQGPLQPAEAARTGREVLAGLRAAHAAGIRHRDVKPANVLLRADGSAVLTDFGIAALQDAASLTMTGEVIGTPEYLAPERIRGADLPSSDLWSLGMMLYVCVEGVSPMRRASTLATLAAVLDEPLPAHWPPSWPSCWSATRPRGPTRNGWTGCWPPSPRAPAAPYRGSPPASTGPLPPLPMSPPRPTDRRPPAGSVRRRLRCRQARPLGRTSPPRLPHHRPLRCPSRRTRPRPGTHSPPSAP